MTRSAAAGPCPRRTDGPETPRDAGSAIISPGSSRRRSAEPPVGGAGGELQEAVIEVLKSIYDPEIPVDIYELGLIYDVASSEDGDAASR